MNNDLDTARAQLEEAQRTIAELRAKLETAEKGLKWFRHEKVEDCETWYDGCHCWEDTVYQRERVDALRRRLGQVRALSLRLVGEVRYWIQAWKDEVDERC